MIQYCIREKDNGVIKNINDVNQKKACEVHKCKTTNRDKYNKMYYYPLFKDMNY